jgi:c-di-GMP-binding flagellar brake protein YcgR
MLNDSDFIVHNKQQIINYLILIFKQKCLIALNFNEIDTFITTLVAIDSKKDLILFDCGPTDYLNKRLLTAINVEFQTNVSGIKVNFQGKGIKKTYHYGEAVFSMPIPRSILWRERRKFYRVKLPLYKPNFLQLIVEDETVAHLPLYDISISGFAAVNEFEGLAHLFEAHRKFKGCRLILENVLNEDIEFEVIYCSALNPNQPGSAQKIGCRFISLTVAVESAIQRYMQQQERKSIARNAN